jgi:Caudovirales tail fibre assembly protein.
MKYQLQPPLAVLDDNGLTISAGWAVVYNVDDNGEFLHATYQYLPVGVGVPANSYLDAPHDVDENRAIIHNGQQWTYPADFRGQLIYSTETGEKTTVTFVGEIPPDYTLLEPTSEFDSWDGEKWVLDTDKQQQHYINVATAQKKQLLGDANEQIEYLQDAIDADIATDNEKTLFAEWKKFRVLLNRIDVNQAPNIDWPNKPK